MIKLIKRLVDKIRLFFFEMHDLIFSMKEFQKEILEDLEKEEKESR